MFVVFLRFSDHRAQASQYMDAHKQWLERGFDDGVFLVAGSLQPGLGGGLIAHNTSLAELQDRVNQDPFVVERVVEAELVELTASRTDPRLRFLLD